MYVYVYVGTHHGPRGPMRTFCDYCHVSAHILRVITLNAHYLRTSRQMISNHLMVQCNIMNAQYLRHAQCALSVHLYPHCAVQHILPALFACPSCCTNFVLYNFCTLRSYVHILRVGYCCTFFVQS